MELMEYIKENIENEVIGVIGSVNNPNNFDNNESIKSYLGMLAAPEKVNKAISAVSLSSNLLNEQINKLSVGNFNKFVVAASLLENKDLNVFYNINKGLSNREIQNFKRIFKAMSEKGKKVILISNDVLMFFNYVKHLLIVDNNGVIKDIKEINWYEEEIYEYVSKPPIIEFVMNLKKRNIKIDDCVETKELLKAIYRSVS